MINVIINPGSGPVANALLTNAEANIQQFIKDCGIEGITAAHSPEGDERGRFLFVLTRGEVQHEVEMPGLPIEQVRYTGAADQSILDFPRLYVDGSSWVWKYAVLNKPYQWEPQPEEQD
jgi:hypothetical protein